MNAGLRDKARVDVSTPANRSRVVARRPAVARSAARMNDAAIVTIMALTIGAVGLLYLVQTSHVAGLGYAVSRLERERAAKSLENEQLSYEIARYQSLPAIERVALDELGMQPMEERVYLTVPLPVHDELPLPPAETSMDRSLAGRVWDRLTGQAEARHPAAEDEASE